MIIRQLDPLNPCRGYITYVMCVRRFSACNVTTGRLLPLCLTVCPTIDSIIEQCSNEFSDPAVSQVISRFQCQDLQSMYNFPLQYVSTNPNDCIELGKCIIIDDIYVCAQRTVSF